MGFKSLDLTAKKWLLAFLLCLFCWWLFSASATCEASGTYQITEQELTQLETNLSKLQQISTTQRMESARLREQLTKSEQDLQMLKSQLDTSTAQLQQAQNSLANANQLLQEYGQEERRTRLRIKAQRNTWITIASCLVIALAVK